jgi:hypothetical protein
VKFNFDSRFGRDGKRVTHPGFRVIFHICRVLIYSSKSADSYSGRATAEEQPHIDFHRPMHARHNAAAFDKPQAGA